MNSGSFAGRRCKLTTQNAIKVGRSMRKTDYATKQRGQAGSITSRIGANPISRFVTMAALVLLSRTSFPQQRAAPSNPIKPQIDRARRPRIGAGIEHVASRRDGEGK